MSIYRGLVTIKRGGVYHPPGSLHDFDDNEATALGASRVKLEADQVKARAAFALTSAAATTLFVAADELPGSDALPGDLNDLPGDLPGSESTGDAASDVPPSVVVPPASAQTGSPSDRIETIKEAFALLEAGDYWKTGKRAGRPKQKPIEDIVGFDISDDDIDAALALVESGL
jgi:hypothetical protein